MTPADEWHRHPLTSERFILPFPFSEDDTERLGHLTDEAHPENDADTGRS